MAESMLEAPAEPEAVAGDALTAAIAGLAASVPSSVSSPSSMSMMGATGTGDTNIPRGFPDPEGTMPLAPSHPGRPPRTDRGILAVEAELAVLVGVVVVGEILSTAVAGFDGILTRGSPGGLDESTVVVAVDDGVDDDVDEAGAPPTPTTTPPAAPTGRDEAVGATGGLLPEGFVGGFMVRGVPPSAAAKGLGIEAVRGLRGFMVRGLGMEATDTRELAGGFPPLEAGCRRGMSANGMGAAPESAPLVLTGEDDLDVDNDFDEDEDEDEDADKGLDPEER